MSAALSSPPTSTSTPAGGHPWFVAVGVRVWQGYVARALNLVLGLMLLAVLVSVAASVWLQGSGAGTAPSEQTLWLWTWAYSTGRVVTEWALVAPLVFVSVFVAAGCASYVQAAPSLAMAKAAGPGTARFGWHVRRTDRAGRRTLAEAGYGALLRRSGRWPLLTVGLIASLTVTATSAFALAGGIDDLGLDPGLLPWLTLVGGLLAGIGFVLLMLDGALIALGPQLQVAVVGKDVDQRGYGMAPALAPVTGSAAAAQPEVAPAPAPTAAAPAPVERTVERPSQPAAPTEQQKRPTGDDLAGRLERLSALHRAGELDDDEFHAAKASLLSSR